MADRRDGDVDDGVSSAVGRGMREDFGDAVDVTFRGVGGDIAGAGATTEATAEGVAGEVVGEFEGAESGGTASGAEFFDAETFV